MNTVKEAIKLYQSGEYKQAEKLYRKLHITSPENAEFLRQIGLCLYNQQKFDRATKFLEKGLKYAKNKKTIINNLSGIYFNLLQYRDVINLYDKHKKFFTEIGSIEALGLSYHNLRQYSDAEKCYLKILNINSKYYKAYAYLADIEVLNYNFDTAIELYQKSLNYNKNYPEANKSIGMLHLLKGDFLLGWEGYEWREGEPDKGIIPNIPLFKENNSTEGKSICVYSEQGFGDTIQFSRYLPLLKLKFNKVIFLCQEKVFRLFSKDKSIDLLHIKEIFEYKKYKIDYQIPLLSLPKLFKTDLNNIPPALSLNIDKQERVSNTKKIGVCWAGNPENPNDINRSMQFDDILPLIKENKNIEFYNLQVGHDKKYIISKTENLKNWFDCTDSFNDFADTANFIQNLDCVISVDTSVAHLAGTLGIKTFLLIPYIPEWRWMLDRKDSPWYPSMTILRQDSSNKWDSSIEKINGLL